MVQILPQESGIADIFERLGAGVSQGYMNRSDDLALQNAIQNLPENASPQDVMNAVIGVNTYSPESKKRAFENLMQVNNAKTAESANQLKRAEEEQRRIYQENKLAFEEMKLKKQLEQQKEIEFQKNQLELQKLEFEKQKFQYTLEQKTSSEERETIIENFLSQGYNMDEAQALANPYVPKSVKSDISKRVEGELLRRERTPGTKQFEGQQALPEAAEATGKVQKQEWPEIPAPPQTTPAEREKWRDKNQTFNNNLLKEIKKSNVAHKNAKIRYGRISELNDSDLLPTGLGRIIINPETGEPYAVASLAGLVNKETQDFVKTVNDFMIDAKTYFGARITNFDIKAFKSRLPTLLNTKDGRRLIIEQMKLMEDLQLVHDNELESALKHYGRNANYSDIQSVVDERTGSKEQEIVQKINDLDKASGFLEKMSLEPKFKDKALMQTPEGKFKAVPKDKVKDYEKIKGYIAW